VAPIRVLIVDDSAFVRLVLTRKLSADPELEVAGIARDGLEALEQVKALRPDVITMDVEMPRADGLTALRNVMTSAPTPVVMLSTLTTAGASTTLKALELGAVDFHPKPTVADTAQMEEAASQLRAKIKTAARARIPGRPAPAAAKAPAPAPFKAPPVPQGSRTAPLSRPPLGTQRVVAIATSTGGPKALVELIPRLPASLKAAYVIVQHMPAHFTRTLADRLDGLSDITVREAQAGDVLQKGVALLAPGGYHMRVNEKGVIELDEGPPSTACAPLPITPWRTWPACTAMPPWAWCSRAWASTAPRAPRPSSARAGW
jgi:two-component system chemotaxis response regulator CheB